MNYLGILLATAVPLIPLIGQPVQAAPAVVPPSDPTVARELIRQWVLTERVTTEEKSQWDVEQARMRELLEIYQKELKLLDEEIDQAGTFAKGVDENRVVMKKELAANRAAQAVLRETLSLQLPRINRLVASFPEPLQKSIEEDREQLMAPDAISHPGNVLKSMLSVLTAAGRFNRTITVVKEIRVWGESLEGSKKSTGKKSKMSVDVIYLGLAQAYYVAREGEIAGVGKPTTRGWKWTARPELADDIRNALAVYHKDRQPQLIQLPVKISTLSKGSQSSPNSTR